MKILDTTNGRIHEYGSNPHDSLEISSDGCSLYYYNLQCGDGSEFGTYRFVMEDGKIPEESMTEDAKYAECYFNIGGFGKRPHGKWIPTKSTRTGQVTNIDYKCSKCSHHKDRPFPYCEICGAKMERR